MMSRQENQVNASISSVDDLLNDMRNGIPVILVDDEDRENEGDLVIAAQMATPEGINFMAKYGRGLICLPMERKMCERLGLELIGRGDNAQHRTAFTTSIEAKEGVTTGISAADRARTIQTAIHPDTGPDDIATPGHIFPLIARDGGVLVRAGHTEAAVDMARMAGFSRAGVICEIMNDDGTMARLPDLQEFAKIHNLKIGTIADLIAYRRKHDILVDKVWGQSLTSHYGGDFMMHIYESRIDGGEHLVLVKGNIQDIAQSRPIPVRMHALDILQDVIGAHSSSSLKSGDVLGGDEDQILHRSMEKIAEYGCGVIVLIRGEEQKSLRQRLMARQDPGEEKPVGEGNVQTLRSYGIGAQILKDLGVRKMILITRSPKAVVGLDGYGLEIAGYCDP